MVHVLGVKHAPTSCRESVLSYLLYCWRSIPAALLPVPVPRSYAVTGGDMKATRRSGASPGKAQWLFWALVLQKGWYSYTFFRFLAARGLAPLLKLASTDLVTAAFPLAYGPADTAFALVFAMIAWQLRRTSEAAKLR
jgi:hypothetical protein